jgi:hypothetical protein
MINNDAMHANKCDCLAWKPIIAGALIAVGLSFLLNLFSVAIGLTAFTINSEGVETLVLGGLIGISIGILASMFAAGWLTGYLGRRYCDKRHLGSLYGFLAWCVSLIIAIFLAAHAQQYVSFYSHFISGRSTIEIANVAGTATISNIPTSTIAISSYILFSLFFLSAFACSLGGHCGMSHQCKNTCA